MIGTGTVGRTLATAWARAGHAVVLGSRRHADALARTELSAALAAGVGVTDPASAAADADVVVNATPGTASVSALLAVGAAALEGKVLLDVGVGFDEEGGLSHPRESLGEEIQRTFPGTRVVKTLVTVDRELMIAPGSLEGPSTVFLSGQDPDAKHTVAGLLADLGWPKDSLLDLGGIATARGQEHYALLFMGIAGAIGSYGFGIRVVPPAGA